MNIIKQLSKTINRETTLIFDLDGTLIDTNYANYLSYINAIKKVKNNEIRIPFDKNKRFTRQTLKQLFPYLKKSEEKEIIDMKSKLYKEQLAETKPNETCIAILNYYYVINRTILATNCREDRVKMTLQYHNLDFKFDRILSRRSTDGPEPINKYENVLETLNIQPYKVIVFENEKSEIKSAIKAGIPFDNIISVNFD